MLKLTRTAVLRELDQDYVTFARSRGLSDAPDPAAGAAQRDAPRRHQPRPGVRLSLRGTILVEVTFALQGIGSLLAGSVTFKDVPVVQAITLITAAVIALTALAVDLFSFAADPRVRKAGCCVKRLPLTPVLCAIPLVAIVVFAVAGVMAGAQPDPAEPVARHGSPPAPTVTCSVPTCSGATSST